MTAPVILFLIRLLSALLLLGFLGTIAWLIYQDTRLAATMMSQQAEPLGYLRVTQDGSSSLTVGTLYPLLPLTTIGRAANSTVVIDNNYTSGEHALLTRRGGQWWLEDLGSRNGTLLNSLPLQEAVVVSAGDLITIGDTQLKIEL